MLVVDQVQIDLQSLLLDSLNDRELKYLADFFSEDLIISPNENCKAAEVLQQLLKYRKTVYGQYFTYDKEDLKKILEKANCPVDENLTKIKTPEFIIGVGTKAI